MKTRILNRQKNHPIQTRNLKRLIDWIGRRLERLAVPDRWDEVCVVLVDDDGITQTNREYFGKNKPTDVISFRYDPVPGEEGAWSGDLVVNVDRAIQAGPQHQGPDYELALYIAHGFDHLSGADDDTDDNRKRMRATETAWLAEAGDLATNLFKS